MQNLLNFKKNLLKINCKLIYEYSNLTKILINMTIFKQNVNLIMFFEEKL